MNQNVTNPYESPRTSAAPQLSRDEQQVLETYLQFRTQPPTAFGHWRSYLLNWLLLAGIMSLGAALVFAGTWMIGMQIGIQPSTLNVFVWGFAVGIVFGCVRRDIVYLQRIVRNVPILLRIIDWQRLERYLYHGTPD